MHCLLTSLIPKHLIVSYIKKTSSGRSSVSRYLTIMSSTTDTPALKTRSPWATETRKLTKSPKRFNVEPAESTHQNASSEVVLVTGGAGFLGQHIVKHLLEQREIPIQEVRVFNRQPLKWSHGLDGR